MPPARKVAMVPNIGRKKDVLTVEKRKATAINRIYLKTSNMMQSVMFDQTICLSEGYTVEEYVTTINAVTPRPKAVRITNIASPPLRPNNESCLETGKV